ncbi:hypothetical protein PanWU01x14_030210, partial [Parasponia andersonii]
MGPRVLKFLSGPTACPLVLKFPRDPVVHGRILEFLSSLGSSWVLWHPFGSQSSLGSYGVPTL